MSRDERDKLKREGKWPGLWWKKGGAPPGFDAGGDGASIAGGEPGGDSG